MTENEAPTPTSQASNRRRRTLLAAGGAAAIVAGGAFAMTQTNGSEQQSLHEPPAPAAIAAISAEVSPAPDVSLGSSPTSAPASSPAPTSAAASSSAKPTSKPDKGDEERKESQTESRNGGRSDEEIRKEIKKARAEAADEGVPLKRPLTAKKDVSTDVSRRTETLKNGTVQVESSRSDLTGQGRLLLAGAEGEPVGSGIKCTNKVRFSSGTPATERPTLLLCWRTSSDRSVVTMAVVPKGKPRAADSIEIIGKEWSRLS
ncbi:hypothetical protein ACQP2E_30425 [Actinoplanes sp. CA-015351]|uniref:hypothetical protein n=1 Tax=Actinoplanes sp. CA-015351 TaxID=3239897 RepID=UPI003D9664A9